MSLSPGAELVVGDCSLEQGGCGPMTVAPPVTAEFLAASRAASPLAQDRGLVSSAAAQLPTVCVSCNETATTNLGCGVVQPPTTPEHQVGALKKGRTSKIASSALAASLVVADADRCAERVLLDSKWHACVSDASPCPTLSEG